MTTNEWIVAYYQTMGWTPEPGVHKAASLDGFKRESKAASDRVWGLKKLRGADADPALKRAIEEIEDTLKQANDQAQKATDAAGLDRARALLKQIEPKAQDAEQAAKKLEAGFDKDLEAMPKYLSRLEIARKARDTIETLPGAKEHLDAMDKLLLEAQALIIKNGSIARGYAAGLEKLGRHVAILEQARAASQQYLKREIPKEVREAWGAAQTKLDDYRKVGPEFQAKLYDKELKDALDSGRDDAKKALAKMAQVGDTVADEVRTQTGLREASQKELKAINELLAQSDKDGVPEENLASARQKKKQGEALMGDGEREYQRATELLKEGKAIGSSVSAAYQKGGKEWAAKSKKLAEVKATCTQLSQWAPLMSRAQALLNETLALEAGVAKTRDYLAAADQLDKLDARKTALESEAEKSGMPDDPRKIKKFTEDCQEASKEVLALCTKVGKTLEELEGKMQDVKNPRRTEYHERLTQCWDAWSAFVRLPTADTVKKLEKEKKAALEKIRKIQTDAKDVLNKPAELQKLVGSVKQTEQKQADSDRPQEIKALLSELKKFEVDVSAEQAEADKITTEQLDPAWGRVRKLEEDLKAKLAKAKAAHEAKVKDAGEKLKRIQKALDGFKSKDRGFEPYLEQLKVLADDAQALIDSGDPYLYKLAKKHSDELVTRMEAIDPAKRPKDAKTFEEVEKKWSALSKELGKGDLVKKRLPDTYAELYEKLNTAITDARELDPEAGLKVLEPLTKLIEDARAKAATEDKAYTDFKNYRKLVEGRWTEIIKSTNTWITDRTRAYEAKFKTRVAEATTLAGQEGKLTEALQKLETIKADLEKINSAPNSRQALQEEDVLADREQKLVVDMARQFDAALELYQKTTLPDLRKALKGEKGADLDQLDSLEKAPKQAERVVEPYLNIVSKLPHKSLAANPAPALDKAKEDFAAAHKILLDATRTAKWLAENPEGTNVKYTGELERVGQDWTKYSAAYAAGVKALAKAINTEGEKEPDSELKQKSEGVATVLLSEATKLFEPKAFAKPLQILITNRAAGDDPKTQNASRAAREKALRTVRRYKRQMLSDPLMVKINSRENPFEPLTRQAGMMRATLKRLELELLGAA